MTLGLSPCGNRRATVEGAGNDFEIQFLGKSHLGSVIAVERNVFEDDEEITFELGVGLGGSIRGVAPHFCANDRGGIVHGAQKRNLLGGGSGGEILSEKLVALLVHVRKAVEETMAIHYRVQ